MSNNNCSYYYPPTDTKFPPPNSQNWGDWAYPPPPNGNYSRPPPPPPLPYPSSPPVTDRRNGDAASPSKTPISQNNFYSNMCNLRSYSPRRMMNMSVPPPPLPRSVPPPPLPRSIPPSVYPKHQAFLRMWSHPNNRKRMRPPIEDGIRAKIPKKKKKSLSQSVPKKRDWSVEDALRALEIEKEYNKRFKNHSLIIKFPDVEVNRDIVSKFHPSIESVHFQQPSTARFCFVTLEKDVDADAVIKELNRIQFGQGYLTAEYKKDREEDQVIGPEHVDPLTLYVGNLGQEVTKDHITKAYPKNKRIDIGYAKKMKYTRYAFVSFRSVDDCIEAFKQTHNTQMFNKTLIVRFRRLHGTVGMRGETKNDEPKQQKPDTENANVSEQDANASTNFENADKTAHSLGPDSCNTSQISLEDDYFYKSDEDSENETERKPVIKEEYDYYSLQKSFDEVFANHRPKPEIKREIKTEFDDEAYKMHEQFDSIFRYVRPIKAEPEDSDDEDDDDEWNTSPFPSEHTASSRKKEEESSSVFPNIDYNSLVDNFIDHANKVNSLRKVIP